MSIADDILAALEACQAPDRIVVVADSATGTRFDIEVDALDSLAGVSGSFVLESNLLKGLSVDDLADVAADLVARINYLMEPLVIVERDPKPIVLVCSSTPQKRDRTRIFYQLMVHDGYIELNRVSREPGEALQQIGSTMTREVFARLAEDFLAVLPEG